MSTSSLFFGESNKVGASMIRIFCVFLRNSQIGRVVEGGNARSCHLIRIRKMWNDDTQDELKDEHFDGRVE